jgi:rubrerythrin
MEILTEKQQKLLVLFKGAIESEKEAQEVYREMLSLNNDPAIQRVVEGLLSEEIQHEEKLLEMYNELRKTDEFKDAK